MQQEMRLFYRFILIHSAPFQQLEIPLILNLKIQQKSFSLRLFEFHN